MSTYDFARRLKRIVYEECEIVKAETKIAQKSAKHCEKLSTIKTTLVKQEQELSKYQYHVKKLVHENERLHNLKREQEHQLTLLLQKLDQLEVEYNNTLQRQIEQNRTSLLQMDCLHNIKLAAQTYIKLKALPKLIQGVTVSEKNSSSQWKPFCIDPSKHTQKEVEDIIWREPQIDSELKNAWEKLILGDILSHDSQVIQMDTSDGNVSVVI